MTAVHMAFWGSALSDCAHARHQLVITQPAQNQETTVQLLCPFAWQWDAAKQGVVAWTSVQAASYKLHTRQLWVQCIDASAEHGSRPPDLAGKLVGGRLTTVCREAY